MSPGPAQTLDIEELLVLLGVGTAGPAAKLVAGVEPGRVLWANREAKALLGTADLPSLTRLVFGPAVQARPLAIRLGRLECGEPARLERLLVNNRFRRFGVTLACEAVAGRPKKIVLMQTLSDQRQPAEPDRPVATATAEPAAPELMQPPAPVEVATPPAPTRPPAPLAAAAAIAAEAPVDARRVQSRFLWRTDVAGTVTHIGNEMAAYLGRSALQIDDDLQARLRALPCDAGLVAADALAAQKSWPPLQLAWPTEDPGRTVNVTFGGTPEPGRAGFRGFGLFRGDAALQMRREAADERPAPVEADPPVVPELPSVRDVATEVQTAVELGGDERVLADEGSTSLQLPESETGSAGPEHRAAEVAAVMPADDSSQGTALAPQADDPAPPVIGRTQSAPQISEQVVRPARVVPFPGFPASGTAKVVHLSTFKAGAPVFSGRATSQPAPPKLPDREPALEPLDAPQWAEAPSSAAASDQRLSSHERFNFDEIARALAALPAGEAAGLGRGPRAEATPAAAASQERSDADAWSLLDAVPVGLLVSQAEAVVFANRSLLDVLGYARLDEVADAGRQGGLYGGPNMGPPGAGGQSFTLIARDGARIEVDARVQKIVWQGAPASLMSVRRSGEEDTRARLGATALDLHRSQQLAGDLAQALDLACSGSALLDPRGRILSLTRGAERPVRLRSARDRRRHMYNAIRA